MSYMECTSLDGNPTFYQKQRISYLRYFKHLVVDSKWLPTKFSELLQEVFKWFITVGLSGIIIYAITVITQPKITDSEIQLKKINRTLKTLSDQIESFKKIQ